MPVVVESPNHHSVFLDEVPLLLPHRVVLIHSFRPVQMVVKRRLVGDDQVFPLSESQRAQRLCVIFSLSPLAYSGFFAGACDFTWAILPRTADRAPAPFALTRAPIDASIALPPASARSLRPPSIPPRDTCDPPRRKSTAEFSFLSRFLSAKISASASTASGKLPAAPATKPPSTSEKPGVLSVLSSLPALKHPPAPRGLFPSFQKCCVPAPPQALLSPRSE